MTIVGEPGEDILELEYEDLIDVGFTTKDVNIPCECPHSILGEHFVNSGQNCEKPAHWRVTLDCNCSPKHSLMLCTECKEFVGSKEGIYSAERID